MLRASAAHVIVPALDGMLDAQDVHHLCRVLRLRAGEVVTMTDGEGGWRQGRFADDHVEPDGPIHHLPRPEPLVTVAFTPVKGDRPQWTVQKLTEVGVDRIVVTRAARSVVRWDSALVERLRRVAREAVCQSRRCYIPTVDGADALPPGALAHFDGAPVRDPAVPVLIGPEGGWTDAELAGRAQVSLGPTVLRAETAAIAAAVRLTGLRDRS